MLKLELGGDVIGASSEPVVTIQALTAPEYTSSTATSTALISSCAPE